MTLEFIRQVKTKETFKKIVLEKKRQNNNNNSHILPQATLRFHERFLVFRPGSRYPLGDGEGYSARHLVKEWHRSANKCNPTS